MNNICATGARTRASDRWKRERSRSIVTPAAMTREARLPMALLAVALCFVWWERCTFFLADSDVWVAVESSGLCYERLRSFCFLWLDPGVKGEAPRRRFEIDRVIT